MMAYRYKKMSAAPYLQGATGLKPKGICDKQPVSFRAFHPNNVEIISYLHNTIFLHEPGVITTADREVAFVLSPKKFGKINA